eukprot:4992021-Pyramimonas_sp.AAC.1
MQIEGVWFSMVGSPLSAVHTHFEHLQELHGLRAVPFQNIALALARRTFDYAGATDTRFLCEEVPGMALWHDSGSSKRNNQ